ncbi:VOC family protein [Solwaraspora sp. WMMD1047]|uniref:VOC family protein n=1 Tax=Solwaraspora sp. WMMD1047 TaxID=3016102 RepID=UPI00241790B7|nr:VOC family protein [Solwaraspora sp. WMMD1047]MDG4831963.1 VOC family protein [Solwaraspora sp. WMMD1047]
MRTIYPIFTYSDARAAIDWLTRAFGFQVHQVHDAPDGSVAHAELIYDTGMIMIGRGTGPDPLPAPDQWSVYVAVDDIEAHHARAKAAGAEIVQDLRDTDYGSRDYSARDLEGYVWSFGTYRA